MTLKALIALMFFLPVLANAQDADRGRAAFSDCAACHMVKAPDGRALFQGAKVGPNLYGIAGRTAGSSKGFNYSPSLRQAGQQGLVWTPETLEAYLKNPTTFLKKWLKDDTARARMAYRQNHSARDIYAFLKSTK